MTISTAGTVIDSKDISGQLTIAANNVTVKNSRIKSGDYYVVEVNDGITGFTIQDSELDGLSSSGTGLRTASATILRNNIHNSVDGILITGSNTTIQDNYIHDLVAPTGTEHIDPITNDGEGNNIIVRHNHIYLASAAHTTACMTFDAFWAGISNVTEDNNLIEGGTFVLRLDGLGSEKTAGHTLTGVTVTNNALNMIGGSADYIYSTADQIISICGNHDYLTGQTINEAGNVASCGTGTADTTAPSTPTALVPRLAPQQPTATVTLVSLHLLPTHTPSLHMMRQATRVHSRRVRVRRRSRQQQDLVQERASL
jgi:hypothetical protein